MRKVFAIIVMLAGMLPAMAETINNVPYIDAAGVEQTANGVNVITTNAEMATLTGGWYVVSESDVLTGTLVCQGAVHLILADGAKLTAMADVDEASIRVSGEGNSLTIYGQSAQSGQVIAEGSPESAGIGGGMDMGGSNITINGGVVTATGGEGGAGIGGGMNAGGSNITINGGVVTATGGEESAGIGGGSHGPGSNIIINGGVVTATGSSGATGIGGGYLASGSNITINGGNITATGGYNGTGIGGGMNASASNIFVSDGCILKAGSSANPTEEIATTRTSTTDIASDLAGKQYVAIKFEIDLYRIRAILAIIAAREGIINAEINNRITDALDAIPDATTKDEVDRIRNHILEVISIFQAGKAEGDAAGYARAKAELPTDPEGTAGTAVTITKGSKSVTLINPDKVTYVKTE